MYTDPCTIAIQFQDMFNDFNDLHAEIFDFPEDELVAALVEDDYYPKEQIDSETQALLNNF